jgi:membrane fusion protein, multidrug efflux system
MKKFLYILIPVILLVIVVGRLKSNKATSEERIYHYDRSQAINVRADTLKEAEVDGEYIFTGSFEPNRETRVSSEVQGKVNAIYVDAGTLVAAGQPLLQLDNSLLKLQLESVEVQIEGLEEDVKRYSVLLQADAVQGIQLEKAELGLRSAKVQRHSLLEQIRKTTVRAPFAGVVTAKLTEVGAFAAPGVPLIQVTDIAQLKFTINVAEADLKIFQPGIANDIVADAYPDIVLSGEVVMIGSKGNIGNSFPVQFRVDNPKDQRVTSGMFGKVVLKQMKKEKRLVIPASSILGAAAQPQVYLIRNGKAGLHSINIGKRMGNTAVVSDGLQDGDIIVTGGFINLFDGANVVVKN